MALIEFKDLPNTDTPINADNLNHNFNELNKANTYSTDEQVIGIWIDGKPIYRKVIDIGTLPNATNKEINTGLDSTVVRPIRMYGYAYNSSGGFMTLPYIITDSGSIYLQYLSSNKIRVTASSDRSSMNGYVVL